MVGVQMREQNRVDLWQPDRAHQLALGALATVDEQSVTTGAQERGGEAAARRGSGGAGAREEDREIHLTSVPSGAAGRVWQAAMHAPPLAFAACWRSSWPQPPAAPPSRSLPRPPASRAPLQSGRRSGGVSPWHAAEVVEVIDGDTLHARLASGRVERVRLIGIDARSAQPRARGMPSAAVRRPARAHGARAAAAARFA